MLVGKGEGGGASGFVSRIGASLRRVGSGKSTEKVESLRGFQLVLSIGDQLFTDTIRVRLKARIPSAGLFGNEDYKKYSQSLLETWENIAVTAIISNIGATILNSPDCSAFTMYNPYGCFRVLSKV